MNPSRYEISETKLSVLALIVSILMLLNFSHPVFSWVVLEVNVMFVLLAGSSGLISLRGLHKLDPLFYYFMVQRLASFVFLYAVVVESLVSFLDTRSLASLILVFKLGLFPFHFWVVRFCKCSDEKRSFLVLVPTKIPLFFISLSAN